MRSATTTADAARHRHPGPLVQPDSLEHLANLAGRDRQGKAADEQSHALPPGQLTSPDLHQVEVPLEEAQRVVERAYRRGPAASAARQSRPAAGRPGGHHPGRSERRRTMKPKASPATSRRRRSFIRRGGGPAQAPWPPGRSTSSAKRGLHDRLGLHARHHHLAIAVLLEQLAPLGLQGGFDTPAARRTGTSRRCGRSCWRSRTTAPAGSAAAASRSGLSGP